MNSGSARDHSRAHARRGGEPARGRQVSSRGPRRRLVERSQTPSLPFPVCLCRRSSDPRWAHGSASAVCEGWVAHAPGTGVGGQRSHGWQSADASERAEARMAVANVRQWGVGNPDLPRRAPSAATGKPPKPNSIACALWWRTGKGSGKSPRVGRGEGSSSVPRPPRSLFQCACAPLQRSEMGSLASPRDHPEITRDHPEYVF